MKKTKVPQIFYSQSCQLRALHQVGGIKIADIIRHKQRYPGLAQFSSATIYRHAKYPLDGRAKFDRRYLNFFYLFFFF